MKLLVNLIVITSLYIIGILIFTSGFLLRRTVIENVSECDKTLPCNDGNRFRRAVILVIDALRHDFLSYVNTSEEKHILPYQSNFNFVHSVIQNQPNNAKLFKFVADPPTTTLQRLKGLTTGSLPTFVDAGSNFDKEEITEDNFIDQLVKQNKSIAFVGDDTWMGLFPNRFSEFHSYPSFNVKDLDTVDNGVIENFNRLIHFTNWTLLIGHMLGVDHCGHTFGPNHIRMKEKLSQMDDFISALVKNLDNDTILFVMGDHGMTKTGDHGGDSDEEVDAALLVYSKTPFNEYEPKDTPDESTIFQVDLVPTISLLLGLPIPYQNLGIIIPELFLTEDKTTLNEIRNKDVNSILKSFENDVKILMTLHTNAKQIVNYVKQYLNVTGPSKDISKLLDSYELMETNYTYLMENINIKNTEIDEEKLKEMIAHFKTFMKSVRNILREQWAKFDTKSMSIGVSFIVITLFLNLSFVLFESLLLSTRKTLGFIFLIVCFFLVDSSYRYLVGFVLAVNLTATFFWVAFGFFSSFSRSLFSFLSAESFFSITLWVLYLISLFSNSFVVYENTTTQYLLQSIIYFQLFYTLQKCLSTQSSRNIFPKVSSSIFKRLPILFSESKLQWKKPMLDLIMYSFLINISIFFSQLFQTCREEQVNCSDVYAFKLLADDKNALSSAVRNKFMLAIIILAVLTYGMYRWLCKNGSLNGWSPASIIGRYILFFISLLISLHWLLMSVSILNANQKHQFNFYVKIASTICMLVFFSVVVLILFPLCLFSLKRSHLKEERDAMNLNVLNNLILTTNNSQTLIPLLYNHLKSQWLNRGTNDEDDKYDIYVYGLATVYSSPVIILLAVLSLLLMVILGFSTAPSLFILLLIIFSLLNFYLNRCYLVGKELIEHIPVSLIITLLLLTSEHFYSIGHHPTIASIKWDSAYYILDGDDNPHILISMIIYLNTFASHIVVGLALPLFIYWPLNRDGGGLKVDSGKKSGEIESGVEASKSLSGGGSSGGGGGGGSGGGGGENMGGNLKGEYILNEEEDKMRSLFHQLSFKMLFLLALKVLFMMVCVTIHRRHLMMWKIFAPRFVYEIAGFLIFSSIIVFNYLFSLRTKIAVDRFVAKLLR